MKKMRAWNVFALLIPILLISCRQAADSNPSQTDIGQKIILTADGDTIKSGVPIQLSGQVIPVSTLPPPIEVKATPELISTNTQQKIPLSISRSFAMPKGDTLYFGQNGIPFPKETSVKIEKIRAIVKEPTKANPFFNNKETTKDVNDYLTMQQGLASPGVHAIEVDKNGFIWMVSNQVGLQKYDGKSFTNYTIPELTVKDIQDLTFDDEGNIWLAGREIIKFDGTFFYLYRDENGKPFKNGREIIIKDKDILVRTIAPRKIIKINPLKATVYEKIENTSLIDQSLNFYFEDNKLFRWTQNTLNEIHDNFFIKYPFNDFDADDQYKRVVYDEKNKTYWLATTNELCSIHQGIVTFYSSDIFNTDGITILTKDEKGQILIKHQSNAFSLLFKDLILYNKKISYITSGHDYRWQNKRTINDKFWIPKNRHGIIRFDPNNFQLFDFPPHTTRKHTYRAISAITEDSQGNLWFGQHGDELYMYKDSNLTHFPNAAKAIPFQVIRKIYEDSKGNIWIASNSGITKFDGQKFIRFQLGEHLGAKPLFRTITEDPKGNLWFGTNNKGIIKFNGTEFTFFTNKNNGDTNTNINLAMITDQSGNIWIGYNNLGLMKYDGERFTLYTENEGLCNNHITSLFEDSRGNIWIGTRGGLSKLVRKKKDATNEEVSFQNFSTEDGLTNNLILTISEDPRGNLWLGAQSCLNLLFFDESYDKINAVTPYCNLGGDMGGQFFTDATVLDSKNRMWWGTVRQLIVGTPEKLYNEESTPTVFLDNLYLNQEFIDFGQLTDFKREDKDYWIGEDKKYNLANISYDSVTPFFNYPINLELPFDINNLTFHFAATNDRDLSKVEFSYFLEGHDKEWSKPDVENKISYQNLSAGSYTFKVKAKGRNQVWSEPFQYNFSITPPWWLTWWAYLIYGILTIGILYYFWQFNLNRRLTLAEAKRVKELDQLKTRLYTNITHEFRTPLTVIMGMNENIKDHQQEKKLIRRNSKNLLRLVNQLLDLSKLESGKMTLDKTQGDIVVYMQYLTESFYSMATEKDIRLTFYSEEDAIIMDYDEVKIQHIIYNLISNAIKFTPKGGKIILHLQENERDGNSYIKLKVKDDGIGITPEKLPHIFDRFYQADNSETRRGEGTGIGLTLTKELIEMMDGQITVDSTIGKGTEFTIWLPIRKEVSTKHHQAYNDEHFQKIAKELVPEKVDPMPVVFPPVTDQHKPSILIIEDNKDVVTYIETLLSSEYTVHIAVDGQKGIDAAFEWIPDIIISDVMMPEKNGYEVCETLKQDIRTSHIPIILLTAKAEQSDKVQGLKYGADAFLTKPFDKEELLVRLEKMIALRQQLQAYYSNATTLFPTETGEEKVPTLEDEFIEKLRITIHENIGDAEFGVPQLVKSSLMSHTQVYRKIKALTGKTPSNFIRSIRLQKGYELLKTTNLNISEIAYDVGFSDPNYFSKTFHKEFGKPPRDIRDPGVS